MASTISSTSKVAAGSNSNNQKLNDDLICNELSASVQHSNHKNITKNHSNPVHRHPWAYFPFPLAICDNGPILSIFGRNLKTIHPVTTTQQLSDSSMQTTKPKATSATIFTPANLTETLFKIPPSSNNSQTSQNSENIKDQSHQGNAPPTNNSYSSKSVYSSNNELPFITVKNLHSTSSPKISNNNTHSLPQNQKPILSSLSHITNNKKQCKDQHSQLTINNCQANTSCALLNKGINSSTDCSNNYGKSKHLFDNSNITANKSYNLSKQKTRRTNANKLTNSFTSSESKEHNNVVVSEASVQVANQKNTPENPVIKMLKQLPTKSS